MLSKNERNILSQNDETVVMQLSKPSEDLRLLEPGSHTYTIIDTPPTEPAAYCLLSTAYRIPCPGFKSL